MSYLRQNILNYSFSIICMYFFVHIFFPFLFSLTFPVHCRLYRSSCSLIPCFFFPCFLFSSSSYHLRKSALLVPFATEASDRKALFAPSFFLLLSSTNHTIKDPTGLSRHLLSSPFTFFDTASQELPSSYHHQLLILPAPR